MSSNNELTISKLYSYKPLKSYIGLEGNFPVKNKDVFVGVEIELEQVHHKYTISTHGAIEDHSLKLNGIEFVTIPIKMRYLEIELYRLFGGFSKEPLVSTRCSTHVHMNVRDMTSKQIVNFVMLYMIFERGLYRISGDRWNSNFCVPLYMESNKTHMFFLAWDNCTQWCWYKYMGLNLSPIWGGESKQIGTIEFRQMHGTTNVKEIMTWCNLITALKRAAQEMDQEEILTHIRTMNTTSGYGWLVKEIFGSWAKLLTKQPTFAEDTEKCIANLKAVIPPSRLGYKEDIKNKVTAKKKVTNKIAYTTVHYKSFLTFDEIVNGAPLSTITNTQGAN